MSLEKKFKSVEQTVREILVSARKLATSFEKRDFNEKVFNEIIEGFFVERDGFSLVFFNEKVAEVKYRKKYNFYFIKEVFRNMEFTISAIEMKRSSISFGNFLEVVVYLEPKI